MTKQIPIVQYLALGDDGPRLRASECLQCGALYLDKRNACARCGTQTFGSRDLANQGRVTSFSIVHQSAPHVPVPFVSALVALDGGGLVKAGLVNVEPTPEDVRLGMNVRLKTFVAGTDDDGTEAVAFAFEPVGSDVR